MILLPRTAQCYTGKLEIACLAAEQANCNICLKRRIIVSSTFNRSSTRSMLSIHKCSTLTLTPSHRTSNVKAHCQQAIHHTTHSHLTVLFSSHKHNTLTPRTLPTPAPLVLSQHSTLEHSAWALYHMAGQEASCSGEGCELIDIENIMHPSCTITA